MTEPMPRRTFLVTGLTLAAAQLPGQPSTPKRGVRQSVVGMAADHQVLASYRKAIEVMSQKAKTDPLSWQFQANMHGTDGGDGQNDGWRWCMHGNWWFLPWHRGYLYFFERIIRKMSGDDGFRLPYWPWEQAGKNVLPAPFRDKQYLGQKNRLYDATRTRPANGGISLRPMTASGSFAADWGTARAKGRFVSTVPALAFGGVRVPPTVLPAKPQSTRQHGAMENLAHDYVHVAVGDGGNMGDPDTAARDPIFWLHHANVDRLWNRWLDDPVHRLPDRTADKAWYDQKFPYYDETGAKVELSVDEILRLAGESYVYDEEERRRPTAVGAAAPREEGAVKESVVKVGSVQPDLKLGTSDFRRPLAVAEDAAPKLTAVFGATATADVEPPAVVLEVEGIQPPKEGGLAFEVFVARKGDDPSEATYLGPITFFGRKGDGHGHGEGTGFSFSQGFDATDVVQKLRRANKGVVPELDVIIRPVSTTGVSAEELAKKKIDVPIKDVTLKVVTEEKK